MKERGILFSAPMVNAMLAGKKTQTRRIVQHEVSGPNPPNLFDVYGGNPRKWLGAFGLDGKGNALSLCPYGVAGDRLWVRETFRYSGAPSECTGPEDIRYAASVPEAEWAISRWRPSIFMPRWASRITLEVTGVRVERLNDISEEDAKAEGVTLEPMKAVINGEPGTAYPFSHRQAFIYLWDAINGKRAAWRTNPFVWVVSFRCVKAKTLTSPAARGAG